MKFRISRRSIAALTASFAAVAGLLLATLPAVAANEGQIASGDIYRVRNVTTNGAFGDPINADKCQELQYKIRLHNPGPGIVHSVTVKVNLPAAAATSNVSTATIRAADADPSSVSDTATVNLASAQSISYEGGTTQLLDSNNNPISGLPDGITQGGINIGNVGVSLNEIRFVQFKAKTSCPETPPPPQPAFECKNLDVTVTSSEDRSVKISAFSTSASNGATFKNAVISWGDNSSDLTTANPVGQTHSYAKFGTFTIGAVAHFDVNGQDKTSDGPACMKTVTFTENKPPTVTPPPTTPSTPSTPASPTSTTAATTTTTPTTLVNTGSGSIAAIFVLAAIAGTLGYRYFLLRKLS
jgi:hypothetical protein